MTDAVRRGLALGGAVLAVALTVHTYVLVPGLSGRPGLRYEDYTLEHGLTADALVLAATGALLVWLRPRNPVGGLLLVSGLLETVCVWGQAYGTRAVVVPGSDLPGGTVVMSVTAGLWLTGLALPATLLLARYPSGRVTGRWSRRVDRAALVALTGAWLGYSMTEAAVTDNVTSADAPLATALGDPLLVVSALAVLGCLLLTAGITVRRALHASYPERPQLALLLSVAPMSAVAVVFSPYEWVGSVFFSLVPGAVVLGVLRYRLLGIEVVVRRALLYASLTGLVLLAFVAVTAAVAGVADDAVSQVVAAAVVAVGVVPARDRLQQVVDRFVYGDRRDPLRALDRLGRGDDLEDVLRGVTETLRVPAADLAVRGAVVAAVGEVPDDAAAVVLRSGSSEVGVLRVAPRSGERALGAADVRLLSTVAPLLALVVRSTQLAQQLQVEQRRTAEATASERARLRRDLHDGLGPSLTGVGLGLEAAQTTDPARSQVILARLRQEVAASLEEVRRIIDDLRPGALETGDLLSLVRQRAESLTATTPVRVTVEAPSALPVLAPAVEAAAVRIVDEALTNVVRHAAATECTVRLDASDGLVVEVLDNGRGFDGPREGGVGLPSMRSRAAALGGSLEVAAADRGTVLVARLP